VVHLASWLSYSAFSVFASSSIFSLASVGKRAIVPVKKREKNLFDFYAAIIKDGGQDLTPPPSVSGSACFP
jgi:hypothetical protein